MSGFFIFAFLVCLFLVLATLALGIFSMMKGGEFNEKYGNKLMRLRVGLQGLALVILALAYFASKN